LFVSGADFPFDLMRASVRSRPNWGFYLSVLRRA